MSLMVNKAATRRIRGLMRLRRMMASGMAAEVRMAAGLSFREAAAGAGIHTTTLYRWESHERRPSGDVALRYLAFLDELSGVRENGHGRG